MRTLTSARSAAAALTTLAVLLGTAACGGGSDRASDSSAASIDSSSSAAAVDDSPAGDDERGDRSGDDLRAEFLDRMATGIADASTAHVTMEFDAGTEFLRAQGDIDYRTDPPSMAMTMRMSDLGPGRLSMRVVGRTMYVNMGELSQGKYFAFDLDDPNSPLGDPDSLSDSMDPMASMKGFKKGLKKVDLVGQSTVDGDPADHYRIVVDTTKMDLPTEAGSLPKTVTYDLWLDADDRLRKLTFSMAGSDATMTTSKWGEPVSIRKPPANQVVDGSSLGKVAG